MHRRHCGAHSVYATFTLQFFKILYHSSGLFYSQLWRNLLEFKQWLDFIQFYSVLCLWKGKNIHLTSNLNNK